MKRSKGRALEKTARIRDKQYNQYSGVVNMNGGPGISQCSGGSNTCGGGPGYQGVEAFAGFYIGGQGICYVNWGAYGNTGIFLIPCV